MDTFIKDYNLDFLLFYFLTKRNNYIQTCTGSLSGRAQLSNFSRPSCTLYAHGLNPGVHSGYYIVAINMVLASPFQVRVLLSPWQLEASTEWKWIPRMGTFTAERQGDACGVCWPKPIHTGSSSDTSHRTQLLEPLKYENTTLCSARIILGSRC